MRRTWIRLFGICMLLTGLAIAEEAGVMELTGSVSGPEAKPVADAQVDLYLLTVDQASMSYQIYQKGQTKSDAEGKFTFIVEQQAVGGYSIYCCLAQKEGLSCGWGTLIEANQSVFNITLTEPEKIIGFVQKPDGTPIQGAEVRLVVLALPGEGEQVMFGIEPVDAFVAKTCDVGRFEFNNLPRGATVEFLVRKPGMGTLHTLNMSMDPSDGLTYKAGQTEVMLTMQDGLKLSGHVVEQADNKPVEGVPVIAMDSQMPVNLIVKPVESGADGAFVFEDLAPGDYKVLIQDNDWISEPITVSISETDVEDAKLELTKGGMVEITIVDSATEELIANAQVQLRNEETNNYQAAQADDSGVAKKQLLAGTYQVSAYAQGYQYTNNVGTIAVENNKTATLTVQLGGQAKITGKILSPDGKPVKDAEVRLVPGSGGREKAASDENGEFKMGWDPEQTSWAEGEFYLVTTAKDQNLAGVELIGVDTEEVTIKLQKGIEIKGRVVNEKTEPISGAQLRLYFHGSRFSTSIGESITTDTDGRYTIGPLASEHRYSVNVNKAEGYGTGRQEIQLGLDESEVTIEDIVLRVADQKLSGQVVDIDDKPVANVRLHCYGSDQPNLNATTGEDGKFSFDNVCPGEIRINANYNDGGEYLYANVQTEGGAEDVKVVLTQQGGSRYVPKQPPSLIGKPLGELSDYGINVPADANSILLFAWDMNQRPSRYFVKQLAGKADALAEKKVTVLLLNTASVDKAALDTWLTENNINYPCGMLGDNAEDVKFKMGIKSLPWLILTDAEHNVIAEGFSVDELEGKLKKM